MKQKTFVIRKLAYYYTDEDFALGSIGGISHVLRGIREQEAQAEFRRIEIDALRKADLGSYEQFSGIGRQYQDTTRHRNNLHAFFLEILGSSLFSQDQHAPENLFIEPGKTMPAELTDEQVWQVRQIGGLRFHEMGVFEDEVVFYALWLPERGHYFGEMEDGPIYFYNSRAEAQAQLQGGFFYEAGRSFTRSGTLEELSGQPAVLRSLAVLSGNIHFDEDKGELSVQNARDDEMISLNEVLRKPLWEVRALPLEKASEIPHHLFEG